MRRLLREYRREILLAFAVGVLFAFTLTALLSCYAVPTYGNDPRNRLAPTSQK